MSKQMNGGEKDGKKGVFLLISLSFFSFRLMTLIFSYFNIWTVEPPTRDKTV